MVAKASTSESANGVPMKIVFHGPFENEMGKGLFTHRILYLSEFVPCSEFLTLKADYLNGLGRY